MRWVSTLVATRGSVAKHARLRSVSGSSVLPSARIGLGQRASKNRAHRFDWSRPIWPVWAMSSAHGVPFTTPSSKHSLGASRTSEKLTALGGLGFLRGSGSQGRLFNVRIGGNMHQHMQAPPIRFVYESAGEIRLTPISISQTAGSEPLLPRLRNRRFSLSPLRSKVRRQDLPGNHQN